MKSVPSAFGKTMDRMMTKPTKSGAVQMRDSVSLRRGKTSERSVLQASDARNLFASPCQVNDSEMRSNERDEWR
jgi:hypothetical protein